MTDPKAIPNPFDNDIVSDPNRPLQNDVTEIHKSAFEVCQNSYNRVVAGKSSCSVLLLGQAGCGKTHLLTRFRDWLEGDQRPRAIAPPVLFVGVRMETGPGYIWRHLRRRFAEELTRTGANNVTPLDSILSNAAAFHGGDLARRLDVAPPRDMGNDLMNVLERYASGNRRRLCRAWLLGDGLSEADLESLNLSQPLLTGDEDSSESDARRLILSISRLSEPTPVVFCFDEIEALGLSPQSKSFGAFTRVAASLVDETQNSLVISTILSTFVNSLRGDSNVGDYHRISKEIADLQPLDWDLGQQLIKARLVSVPELGNQHPIAESDLRAFYAAEHGRATPRHLIHEARRLFAQWQQIPEEPQISPQEFLRVQFDRLWNESPLRRAVTGGDEVLSHGLPVALQLLGSSFDNRPSKHAELTVTSSARPVRVALGNQTNMNSFGAWLRKLQSETPPGTAVCILRDSRLPISASARGVQARMHEIEENGGTIVRVDAEALAAVDAMRRLLSVATSGDLSHNGGTVEPATVREWLARNLPQEIASFVEQIAGKLSSPTSLEPDALIELLNREKVVPLDDAIRLTNLPREQIENYARTHPHRIGLFGGAHPVVCQAVLAAARGAASAAG